MVCAGARGQRSSRPASNFHLKVGTGQSKRRLLKILLITIGIITVEIFISIKFSSKILVQCNYLIFRLEFTHLLLVMELDLDSGLQTQVRRIETTEEYSAEMDLC